jgi:glycosyltransferase involved in cell wall biosynthesis
MKITVIVCTYNRCESLAKTLETLAASEMPPSAEWEVLVVDNNSKDQTRAVIESYCQKYPGCFRYWFEGKQGKSFALNTAIRESKGFILAFTDDDVLVSPAWLRSIAAPLESGKYAGVGGRILSQEMPYVPKWLPLEGEYSLAGMLALFDLGDAGVDLETPPFGANVAFRKEVFEKYGDYRTDMGPCPGSELRNEDTEFGRRLFIGGEKLWYEPAAVVYHAVPESRLQKDYFLRFWYDHGRARIREGAIKPGIAGIPRWCLSLPWIYGCLIPQRIFNWWFSIDPKKRFFHKGTVWMMRGQAIELPRRWFNARKQEKNKNKETNELRPSVASRD